MTFIVTFSNSSAISLHIVQDLLGEESPNKLTNEKHGNERYIYIRNYQIKDLFPKPRRDKENNFVEICTESQRINKLMLKDRNVCLYQLLFLVEFIVIINTKLTNVT